MSKPPDPEELARRQRVALLEVDFGGPSPEVSVFWEEDALHLFDALRKPLWSFLEGLLDVYWDHYQIVESLVATLDAHDSPESLFSPEYLSDMNRDAEESADSFSFLWSVSEKGMSIEDVLFVLGRMMDEKRVELEKDPYGSLLGDWSDIMEELVDLWKPVGDQYLCLRVVGTPDEVVDYVVGEIFGSARVSETALLKILPSLMELPPSSREATGLENQLFAELSPHRRKGVFTVEEARALTAEWARDLAFCEDFLARVGEIRRGSGWPLEADKKGRMKTLLEEYAEKICR